MIHYKTLFRLLVRLLGIYFIVSGAASLLYAGITIVLEWVEGDLLPFHRLYFASMGSGMLRMVAGLYFLLGGRWVIDRVMPSNRPYCEECGYELTGTAGDGCPECGGAIMRGVRMKDVEEPSEPSPIQTRR